MEQEFFINNRNNLVEVAKGKPIILTAYSEMQRSSDSAWRFEQEANFWYLTGIDEPNWLLIITANQSILVAPDVSKIAQIFSEHLTGSAARTISGVDKIINHDESVSIIAELSKTHREVLTILPQNVIDHDFSLNSAQAKLNARLRKIFDKVGNVKKDILKLRSIKQLPEIMMLRRAVNLTGAAFKKVKDNLPRYNFEYQAQAKFTYEFERAGAAHAYDPIVAGGANAITLHYNSNRSVLEPGDLVLMDVGARYGGYSADITRTYINGDINKRQKLIHEAIRIAKNETVALIKPGVAIRDYIENSDKIMQKALESVDLMKSADDFRRYFPHAVSHGLGIETHDTLGGAEVFAPGMVLTVEPGIYVPEEGIGVRLEDDVLVTETGVDNLAKNISDSL